MALQASSGITVSHLLEHYSEERRFSSLFCSQVRLRKAAFLPLKDLISLKKSSNTNPIQLHRKPVTRELYNFEANALLVFL